MLRCECQGNAGQDGQRCAGTYPVAYLARCEALLCALCAGGGAVEQCCACGAKARGHFRALADTACHA
jgi:hypothetical protein